MLDVCDSHSLRHAMLCGHFTYPLLIHSQHHPASSCIIIIITLMVVDAVACNAQKKLSRNYNIHILALKNGPAANRLVMIVDICSLSLFFNSISIGMDSIEW